MKKAVNLLINFIIILSIIACFPTSNVRAISYETAIFPMQYLNISQGIYGSFSHSNELAIDLIGVSSYKIEDLYMPFTGNVVHKDKEGSGNAIYIQSLDPVLFANGTTGYMTICVRHDNNIDNLNIGQKIKQGEIFYQEGSTGYAKGTHVHLEVYIGKYDQREPIHPAEALFLIKDATILYNDYGYNWRYVDLKPSQPLNLTAKLINYNTIQLNWSAISGYGSISYKVLQSESPKGQYKQIETRDSANLSVSNLKTDKIYYYKVLACID